MNKCYVDTSAFIAFCDRSDTYHDTFVRLFSKPPPLLTTPLVIAEGHAWFLRRYDGQRALRFISMIEDMKPLGIARVGPQELASATTLMRKFADQDLTMADAVGLHLMAEKKVDACWSTDRHMGLTGIPLAIKRF